MSRIVPQVGVLQSDQWRSWIRGEEVMAKGCRSRLGRQPAAPSPTFSNGTGFAGWGPPEGADVAAARDAAPRARAKGKKPKPRPEPTRYPYPERDTLRRAWAEESRPPRCSPRQIAAMRAKEQHRADPVPHPNGGGGEAEQPWGYPPLPLPYARDSGYDEGWKHGWCPSPRWRRQTRPARTCPAPGGDKYRTDRTADGGGTCELPDQPPAPPPRRYHAQAQKRERRERTTYGATYNGHVDDASSGAHPLGGWLPNVGGSRQATNGCGWSAARYLRSPSPVGVVGDHMGIPHFWVP